MRARSFCRASWRTGSGSAASSCCAPGFAVVKGLAVGGAVVSQLMGLEAGQEFAAVPDVEQALAEQSAQGPFLGGIDVARRNEVGAQEMGDLLGVNAVVLVLAAVNGLEVERVGQAGSARCRMRLRREAPVGSRLSLASRTCIRRRRSDRGDRARRV